MKRNHTCRTCYHFRPGAPSDMSKPAPVESDADIGVCEAGYQPPARDVQSASFAVGVQPIVHHSRFCSEHALIENTTETGRVEERGPWRGKPN